MEGRFFCLIKMASLISYKQQLLYHKFSPNQRWRSDANSDVSDETFHKVTFRVTNFSRSDANSDVSDVLGDFGK